MQPKTKSRLAPLILLARSLLSLTLAQLFLLSQSAFAQDVASDGDFEEGQSQYQLACAECHEGALLEAPQRTALALFPPERIVQSLESGIMATAGMALTRDEKRQVAYYLTGGRYDENQTDTASFSCEPGLSPGAKLTRALAWNGWGGEVGNTRYRANETTLTKDNVGQLQLKWAFAFPNATRSRAQPVVTPEVVFTGSQDGTIYALDSDNGCPLWTFNADGEVRGSLFVDTDDEGVPETILFGDFTAHAYAVNAQTGELLWKTKVHDHEAAIVTGSVIAHEDTLIVPLSSLEVILASRTDYQCCTFRGALVALSISTGEELWRTHTTDRPRPTILSSAGTQQYGPSGA
ncbi:MAG TPA: hypothetical protein DCR00_07920, partial [Gammaproteobacteria bacterium]|nr:hypothetical protein [Gammaproteobacteria bacterium]